MRRVGLYDVRCALSGVSSFCQPLTLVLVHGDRPTGLVLRGHTDRGGAICQLRRRPAHADQIWLLRALLDDGRLDISQAWPPTLARRRRSDPDADPLSWLGAMVASWQVGGGGPALLDGQAVDMLPVLGPVAEAAADVPTPGGQTPHPAFEDAIDPEDQLLADGVLAVYRRLGGALPHPVEHDQLYLGDPRFEIQRRAARARLFAWPALVQAVEGLEVPA